MVAASCTADPDERCAPRTQFICRGCSRTDCGSTLGISSTPWRRSKPFLIKACKSHGGHFFTDQRSGRHSKPFSKVQRSPAHAGILGGNRYHLLAVTYTLLELQFPSTLGGAILFGAFINKALAPSTNNVRRQPSPALVMRPSLALPPRAVGARH